MLYGDVVVACLGLAMLLAHEHMPVNRVRIAIYYPAAVVASVVPLLALSLALSLYISLSVCFSLSLSLRLRSVRSLSFSSPSADFPRVPLCVLRAVFYLRFCHWSPLSISSISDFIRVLFPWSLSFPSASFLFDLPCVPSGP